MDTLIATLQGAVTGLSGLPDETENTLLLSLAGLKHVRVYSYVTSHVPPASKMQCRIHVEVDIRVDIHVHAHVAILVLRQATCTHATLKNWDEANIIII